MLSATDPLQDDARQLGNELFEQYNIYEGEGFRNHNLRLAAFADALIEARGLTMNPGRTHLLAMAHDLGLISEADQGADYLLRSWALLERECKARGLEQLADSTAFECVRFNHRLSPVPNLDPRAEAFRCAVWVEHSFGAKRFGLPRELVRGVFRRYPRDNFNAVMADFWRRVLLHEPTTVIRGIFL
jgi:hypothetical protein